LLIKPSEMLIELKKNVNTIEKGIGKYVIR